MVWKLSERAADLETKVVPVSEGFKKHLSAEERMRKLQAELRAKKANS